VHAKQTLYVEKKGLGGLLLTNTIEKILFMVIDIVHVWLG
jgi:hypothetical protein